MEDLKKHSQQFWDKRPCNIRHSNAPVGSRSYSTQVTRRKYKVEPHIKRFADHANWYKKRVLDLGCGIGTDTLEFARHGATVVAVDFSAVSLDILQKRAESEHLDHKIRPILADIESWNMAGPFDLVWSFGVLHHTPHPERALRQAFRSTRPGGKLRIMLYHRYSFKALWILATYGRFQFWKWDKLIQENSEAQTGCPLTRTYTENQAVELVENAGWRVLGTQIEHIFPYQIQAYKEGKYIREWYWRYMPKPLFRWLETHFGWHLLLWAEKPHENIYHRR